MRRTMLLLSALVVLALLGSDSRKEYDDRTVYLGIEGTWRLTEIGTKDWRINAPVQRVETFRDETCTFKWDDGDTWRGNYRIDSTHKPLHFDLIPIGGRSLMYIYQIDGDTLRMAHFANLQERPQGFSDEGVSIETYKRVK